jgi:hypothetical protein
MNQIIPRSSTHNPQKMSNKIFKTWDINGTESQKLHELFNLHQQTEGKAGVNPDLTKPSIILEQVLFNFISLCTQKKDIAYVIWEVFTYTI